MILKKSIHELKTSRGKVDAEDLRLLQRVAIKDKVAFEKLYARFYPQLSRYLSRLMRRPEMVEEVVNDTLFVVWEKAEQFQGRSKVSTWITGIAYFQNLLLKPFRLEELLSRVENLLSDDSSSIPADPKKDVEEERLTSDRRYTDHRQKERRTNVIVVDFERRREEKRKQYRRVFSRRTPDISRTSECRRADQ